MKYNFAKIEPKWQKRWDEAKAFQAVDFSEKKKTSSRDEGLRLLHGLETNLATSLQTPQEA